MYPARFFLALGVATFVAALLLLAPLARVQSWLSPASPLRAIALEGRLVEGHAQWPSGSLRLDWALTPTSALMAGIGGDWALRGDGIEAAGDFLWHPWGLSIDVERADVAAVRLNRRLASTGAELEQPLLARGLDLWFGPLGGLRGAKGRLAFGPGQLRLRDRPEPLALPALRGEVDTADGVIGVVVDGEAAPGQALLAGDYDPSTREARIRVFQRGAGMFGIAIPPGRSPDTVLFEWRQVLR